jgi:hypothetical protein
MKTEETQTVELEKYSLGMRRLIRIQGYMFSRLTRNKRKIRRTFEPVTLAGEMREATK